MDVICVLDKSTSVKPVSLKANVSIVSRLSGNEIAVRELHDIKAFARISFTWEPSSNETALIFSLFGM